MTKSNLTSTPRSNGQSKPKDQPSTKWSRWRPSVNITPVERGGRILLGAFIIVAGVVLLVAGGSVLAIVVELLFVAAGFDLLATGALGHCPLYRKLGHVPTSLRRAV